jgi:hypothetical protein
MVMFILNMRDTVHFIQYITHYYVLDITYQTLTTSSGISYQLRDIYSIYRCCWNVVAYEWKVYNGKSEIISSNFVLSNKKLFDILIDPSDIQHLETYI